MTTTDHNTMSGADRTTDACTDQDAGTQTSVQELAAATTIVAELLCERIDLRPGQIVLDVATGTGNGALAAARRGCRVHGIDRVPALLERARERARAERLRARFQLGDAEVIPFRDASFDTVLSVFGVTFAADAPLAAAEMSRVCRPGGTIALTSWTPESVVGTLLRRPGPQAAATRPLLGPTAWGTEPGVRALFGAHARAQVLNRREFVFRCRSPEHFLKLVQIYSSSSLASFRPSDHLEDHVPVLVLAPVVRHSNQVEDSSLIVPVDYVEVVVSMQ